MVSAISSSIDRVSGSNADYSISFQIAALEQQLAVYQRQLENAQQASTQSSQQQTEQIKAQIAQLEAQIAQLKTQQTQQAQQAQQISAAGGTESASKTGHSNFPDVIVQALAESIADNSNTLHESATSSPPPPETSSVPKQNPQAALHTFMHNLFTALGQENVTAATGASSPENPTAHTPHRGEHITASIQSLIQHLDENTQTGQVGKRNGNPQILNNLDSSFHDLIGLLNSTQEQAASITGTTLQSFLHNLSQDLSNGQDISGALIDTEV